MVCCVGTPTTTHTQVAAVCVKACVLASVLTSGFLSLEFGPSCVLVLKPCICHACMCHAVLLLTCRSLIGPAMYFGLMGEGQPIGRYDDMWAGWCSKVDTRESGLVMLRVMGGCACWHAGFVRVERSKEACLADCFACLWLRTAESRTCTSALFVK